MRCHHTRWDMWDDDGSVDDKLEVMQIEFRQKQLQILPVAIGAVCFSKTARWYSGAGNFVLGGGETSVDSILFLCTRNYRFCHLRY